MLNNFLYKLQNVQMVQFQTGEYGLRKGWILHRFLDIDDVLKNNPSWNWRFPGSEYFHYCRDCNKENVLKAINFYFNPKYGYRIIKINFNNTCKTTVNEEK